MHAVTYVHTYIHTYVPITVTVPSLLLVVGVNATTHWKVVEPLIENTVNEENVGEKKLFS